MNYLIWDSGVTNYFMEMPDECDIVRPSFGLIDSLAEQEARQTRFSPFRLFSNMQHVHCTPYL